MMIIRKIDQSRGICIAVFFLLSLAFQMIVSVYNTPLNPYYGYDSAFFLLIGKGIVAGKIPYIDLYDQKGPMIFYINALGYWLTGNRWGVFALQVLFLTASLLALYSLLRLILDEKRTWLCIVLFLFLYTGTIKEGDMTEEWSLIFSLLPMWLSVRFLLSGRPTGEHPLGYSLLYGPCAGILALFRVTNAALIAGVILAFTALLVKEKDWAALGKNALAVMAGAAAAILPWCLYFKKVGAFDDFVFASLTHNFHYAVDGAASKSFMDWAAILFSIFMPIATAAASPWLLKRQSVNPRVLVLTVFMGLTGAFAMTLGYGFRHYFLIIAPVITLDYAIWLCRINNQKERSAADRRRAAAILAALILLPYCPQMVRQGGKVIQYTVQHKLDREKRICESFNHYIPRGSENVWGYNVRAKDYLYMDVLPCQRFFAEQEWMMEANPWIRPEIEQTIFQEKPEWIFMSQTETEMISLLTNELGYSFPEGFDYEDGVVLLHLMEK